MKKSLLICLLFIGVCASNASAESTWTKIGQTGGNIVDMQSFPSNPDIMLACVANGGIYRSTDRGDHWTQIIADVCNDISISEDEVAFVAGEAGVQVSHDFGANWAVVDDASATHVLAHRDGVVASNTGGSLWNLSRDNGETWNEWPGTEMTYSLFFHEDGSVYWAGRQPENYWFIVKHAAAENLNEWELGKNFYGDYNPSLNFVFSEGDSAVYAYSIYVEHNPGTWTPGGVWRGTDDGKTWELLTDKEFSVTRLYRYEDDFIIGSYGNLYYSSGDLSQPALFGSFSDTITAVDFKRLDSGETIVATAGGIYKTIDRGLTWQKSDDGIVHDVVGSVQVAPLWGGVEHIIYATKYNGIIYSEDGGNTWITANQNISVTPGLLKVSPSSPQRAYAGSKYVYMSDDYGVTWDMIPDIPFPHYGVYACTTYDLAVDPLDSNHIAVNHFIMPSDYSLGVYHIRGQFGDEWEWSEAEDMHPYSSATQFDTTGELTWRARYYSTPSIAAFSSQGEITQTITLPENEHPYLWRVDGSSCYILSDTTNNILISQDLGETWDTHTLAVQPYQRGSWYDPSPLGDIVLSPDRSTIFLLYPGNGIIASTDNGETWGHFDDGIDTELVYQIAFSPSDPSVMYAATETGLYRCDSPVVITDTVTSVAHDPAPATYPVIANHPNPFNPATTITYTLHEPGMVSLSVYSVTGQMVATLVDEPMTAGTQAVQFDGTGLASGVYFARLEAGGAVETSKMLLVK